MNFSGQRDQLEAQRVLIEVFDKIHAAGKASGTLGGTLETAQNVETGVLYHYHISTAISSNAFFKSVRSANAHRIAPQEYK
jgi:hypothetical protein